MDKFSTVWYPIAASWAKQCDTPSETYGMSYPLPFSHRGFNLKRIPVVPFQLRVGT